MVKVFLEFFVFKLGYWEILSFFVLFDLGR
jgi:hypothetical protein